ncbi:hypothetical protein RND81_14G087100 [Saponaria officinalis]|uniref:Reverse transcriptase domain-containing protein n=1 Tax=Saponaria officinalis TaxID=3572 RepID=A0AAW1GQ67_SAPOF
MPGGTSDPGIGTSVPGDKEVGSLGLNSPSRVQGPIVLGAVKHSESSELGPSSHGAWNIRGCNDPLKLREVADFLRTNNLDVCGILETRVKNRRATKIGQQFTGFKVTHNCSISNGRVWVIWNPRNVSVTVLEVHMQFIHCQVLHHGTGVCFRATFIYASNDAKVREELWSSMVRISGLVQSWIILGDFNVVRDVQERISESAPALTDILAFNACLLRCGLDDLKGLGCSLTWTNKQDGNKRVWSKLDRALVNGSWLADYLSSSANFLPSGISDHSPCIVSIFEDKKRPPRFNFLHCWVNHPSYIDVVQSAWNISTGGTAMHKFFAKLRNVRYALRQLHKSIFSSIHQRLSHAKQALDSCQEALQQQPLDPHLQHQEEHLQTSYTKLRGVELSILCQRAKFSTIVHNDSSKRAFHARIRERRHSQIIGKIFDRHGNFQTGLDKVAASFVEYYESLLGTSTPVDGLNHMFITLDDSLESNVWPDLTAQVTEAEIQAASQSIDIMKSPGPDGFSSAFFIKSWDIIKYDLCNCVMEFFSTGIMAKQANSTLVTLVPKKSIVHFVLDFRPISCCTVVYKIIRKILANRIQKKFLTPRSLIKVDIRKAFDSLQWDFIADMLRAFNFPPQLITWLMACITGSWFSFSINGEVHGFFKGRSDIRQGDPLSPYVFVLSMEILSRYLRRVCRAPNVSLHPKCAKLNLTHLIFADDLMIFTRGDVPSVKVVKEAMEGFARWFGLYANLSKTEIFFGGVGSSIKAEILDCTGFVEGQFPVRYLGLPLNSSRVATDMYAALISKIQHSIQHWTSKLLSYADKVQLINSVIFGLETYWCSGVLLPKGIVKQINRLCKGFFWHNENGHSKIVHKSWASMCAPWEEGGFGIKELLSWNKAVQMKRLWELECGADGIWLRWTVRYYLAHQSIWEIQSKAFHSEGFRGLLQVRDDLVKRSGGVGDAQCLLSSCVLNGMFSVSKAYDFFRTRHHPLIWTKALSSSSIIPSHRVTTTLAGQRRLATVDNIMRRGVALVNRCSLCYSALESHRHLFFCCAYSGEVWLGLTRWMGIRWRSHDLLTELHWASKRQNAKHWKMAWFRSCICAAVYHIWQERNRRIFLGADRPVEYIVRQINDTGNLVIQDLVNAHNFASYPYGLTIHKPTGRCSDGLLMIDQFSKFFNKPLLNPYLDRQANFSQGVNFALAGSTALDTDALQSMGVLSPVTTSSLNVQLDWFRTHLESICDTALDFQEKLSRSLILIETGGNDYNYAMLQGKPMDQVRGCLPIYKATFGNYYTLDKLDCLDGLNDFASFHNAYIKKAIKELQKEYPEVAVVYGDYYSALSSVLKNVGPLGFDVPNKFKTCCGSGDNEYNSDLTRICGSQGYELCGDPNKYISWDGIHMTQQTYKRMSQ